MGCVMRIIRFRRLSREPEMMQQEVIHFRIDGRVDEYYRTVEVWHWEIAFSEAELWAELDGEMAEIIIPAKAWYVRLWRIFFPLKMVEVDNEQE